MDTQVSRSPYERVDPVFSIILATYNRSRHIVPTILSVLRQTFRDFELFIVGDCCTDDTQEVVRPFVSGNVHWLNLLERGGSQSYPNNAGLKSARGQYVAYIGHDDLWAPDHLRCLNTCFLNDDRTDFVVSGCILHGPPDSNVYRVTGIFDEDSAKYEHFFPPSSFSHKLSVIERIGLWRDPMETRAAVDRHFLLQATSQDMQFKSTKRVTVHKFSAAQRHLCYVRPSSQEQQALLQVLTKGEAEALVDQLVEKARLNGQFMTLKHEACDKMRPGQRYRTTMRSRGLDKPPLRPAKDGITISQTSAPAGLDWERLQPWLRPYRMSGKNPRPKLLVPVTHTGLVRLQVEVVKITSPYVLENLSIKLNDQPISFRTWKSSEDTLLLIFEGMLMPADYSVLEFDLMPKTTTGPITPGRIGISNIQVFPLSTSGT